MGYFKKQSIKNGDAQVKLNVLDNVEVVARVWVQPAEPEVGIFNSYVDDWELYDEATGEQLTEAQYSAIAEEYTDDRITELIEEALEALGEDCNF